MLATASPYPQYFDTDGSPLDAGYLYFGAVSQNPETSPVTVYWDAAGTQPASQPIRTLNGYAARNGAPALIFAAADYSLSIKDRRGRLLAYAPDSSQYNLATAIAAIRTDLANASDATKGDALLGVKQPLPGAIARTQHEKNADTINAADFGVKGDWDGFSGSDNYAILQDLVTWAYQNQIGFVDLPRGRIRISKPLYLYGSDNYIRAGVTLRGAGVQATTLERSGNATTADGSWYAAIDATVILTPYPAPVAVTPDTGTYNVGLLDLTVSGNAAGSTVYGVYTKDDFGQVKVERACILNTQNSFRTDANLWLSSFENLSMHPVQSGYWMNKSGTSINLKNVYVLGGGAGGGVGFNLQSLYSHAESVACEGFTGTQFQFRFAGWSVNGLGVESAAATGRAIGVSNSSTVTISAALILCPNGVEVATGCSLKLEGPQFGDEFAPAARAGSMWFVAGTGNLSIENLRAYDTFAAANTGFALVITSGTSGSGALGLNKIEVQGNTSDNSQMCADMTNAGGTRLFGVRNDGAVFSGLAAASPYNNTSAAAANVGVDSSGILFRSTSSLRYKTNVLDMQHGLAEVLNLRPVTYRSRSATDGSTVFGGLIAEEVDAAGLSEFVIYADDGTPDALAYANMVALLVKAIQEQQAQISALAAKVGGA